MVARRRGHGRAAFWHVSLAHGVTPQRHPPQSALIDLSLRLGAHLPWRQSARKQTPLLAAKEES
jgi:hypothetical protein